MNDDDRLLAELHRAADVVDPMPSHLLAAAVTAFTFRTMEDELATLVFDSALHDEMLVRTSATTTPSRVLSFQAEGVTIELEVIAAAGSFNLIGQLQPPSSCEIDVIGSAGISTVTADDLGRFTASVTGPFCLRIHLTDRQITTEWISP